MEGLFLSGEKTAAQPQRGACIIASQFLYLFERCLPGLLYSFFAKLFVFALCGEKNSRKAAKPQRSAKNKDEMKQNPFVPIFQKTVRTFSFSVHPFSNRSVQEGQVPAGILSIPGLPSLFMHP